MTDIFISYSRKDQEYVDLLKPIFKRLQLEENTNYFQDIDNILPGEDFEEIIHSSITDASIIICLLGPNFFASTFIQEKEIPYIESAHSKKTKVIPVLLDNVYIPPNSFFSTIQQANTDNKTLLELRISNNHSNFLRYFEEIIRNELKRYPGRQKNGSKMRYNIVVVKKLVQEKVN